MSSAVPRLGAASSRETLPLTGGGGIWVSEAAQSFVSPRLQRQRLGPSLRRGRRELALRARPPARRAGGAGRARLRLAPVPLPASCSAEVAEPRSAFSISICSRWERLRACRGRRASSSSSRGFELGSRAPRLPGGGERLLFVGDGGGRPRDEVGRARALGGELGEPRSRLAISPSPPLGLSARPRARARSRRRCAAPRAGTPAALRWCRRAPLLPRLLGEARACARPLAPGRSAAPRGDLGRRPASAAPGSRPWRGRRGAGELAFRRAAARAGGAQLGAPLLVAGAPPLLPLSNRSCVPPRRGCVEAHRFPSPPGASARPMLRTLYRYAGASSIRRRGSCGLPERIIPTAACRHG